jgi:hypothetical protein
MAGDDPESEDEYLEEMERPQGDSHGAPAGDDLTDLNPISDWK